MTDLIAIQKIAGWEKLKTLVLDSVSSPITKRVYNMALNEFMEWFQQTPRSGFTKATVSAWPGIVGGAQARDVVYHHSDVGDPQIGCGGRRQRPARAGVGRRHQSGEERKMRGHPRGQLALGPPGSEPSQRTRRRNCAGPT